MRHDAQGTGIIDQGVARDTGLGLVSLGETAVNHHEFATGLNGVLALAGMDRHVSVDDVRADPL